MKIATENIAVANTITKANKNLQGAKILQLIKMMLKAHLISSFGQVIERIRTNQIIACSDKPSKRPNIF